MTRSQRCPCGSRKLFSNCCKKYFCIIMSLEVDPRKTTMSDWFEMCANPTAKEFMKKAKTYIFRISWLLENLLERYFIFPLEQRNESLESSNDPIFWIEHNTLLCLFGSLSCLKQGLFVQSGIILRSAIENCFVLVDLHENKDQVKKLSKNKYSVNGLLGRTKSLLPDCLVDWYGYFSNNFTHFGPIHTAPYLPRKCWPDNWVLVTGIQNVLKGFVGFGIVLERLHFYQSKEAFFWKFDPENKGLIFDEHKPIWKWIEELVTIHSPCKKNFIKF